MRPKAYIEHEGVSYSQLSKLATSPKVYKFGEEEGDDSDNKYQLKGSEVDVLTFEPDTFDSNFIVIDKSTYPVDSIKGVVDELFKRGLTNLELRDSVTSVATELNYQPNWKWDTKWNRIKEDGKSYMTSLAQSKGRKVIPNTDYFKANEIVSLIKDNQFTQKYFRKGMSEDGRYEVRFQVPVYWNIPVHLGSGVITAKSLFDIIFIDHELKTIRGVDLKTTGRSWKMFPYEYVKWKYYLQAAFYTGALLQYRGAELMGYTIVPFEFIVVESSCANQPVIFPCSQGDLIAGKIGGTLVDSKRVIKGYEQLIKELLWHQEHDLWDYPMEVYENNGRVVLESFN